MERRNFSAQFKQQIVQECSETGNVNLVFRKHDLNANMVRRWVKQVNEVGGKTPPTRGQVTNLTPEELKQLQEERKHLSAENEQMKKTMGEQALEISILRDLLKKQTLTCGQNSHCAQVDHSRVFSHLCAAHRGGLSIHLLFSTNS